MMTRHQVKHDDEVTVQGNTATVHTLCVCQCMCASSHCAVL